MRLVVSPSEDDAGSLDDDEMTTSQRLTLLSFVTKRGSNFGFKSSLVLRGES